MSPEMASPQPAGGDGFIRRHRVFLRRLASTVLVLVSTLYIYRALSGSIDQLAEFDLSLEAAELVFLLLGVLGTLILSTLYHVVAVRRVEAHAATDTRVALAYALGQVMRYVPGKVFGIVFQINFLSGQVRGASIAMALLVQMFHDYAWTFVLVASVLLSAKLSSAWPMVATVPALALVWLIHREGILERLLAQPGFLRRFLGDPGASQRRRPAKAWLATALIALVWIPMLLGVGIGFGGLFGMETALVLGVLYLAAALISLLVVVVPSGLVIREALFVWIGAQYGIQPATLVFVGLLLRICLTASEILNLAVFFVAERVAKARAATAMRNGASHGR